MDDYTRALTELNDNHKLLWRLKEARERMNAVFKRVVSGKAAKKMRGETAEE